MKSVMRRQGNNHSSAHASAAGRSGMRYDGLIGLLHGVA
jgi:hypothetical protein